MAGTSEGAQKARDKNLKNDPEYYSKIGQRSWKNTRSHATGFALLSRKKHIELSAKGGKKTKSDYQTTVGSQEEGPVVTGQFRIEPEQVEYETAETIHEIFKEDTDSDGPILSE